jgi:hypothetical protein
MTATFDEWLVAYDEVYAALPDAADVACPNCGHHTLRLVFTGDLDRAVGFASFWCDTCLQGVSISRAPIPDGAIVKDIHLPLDEQPPEIPDFRLAN